MRRGWWVLFGAFYLIVLSICLFLYKERRSLEVIYREGRAEDEGDIDIFSSFLSLRFRTAGVF
jgi:hypothetical protein